MPRFLVASVLVVSLVTLSCAPREGAEQARPSELPPPPLVVAAVNYPLAYFTERIGGDLVEVRFPAPAGDDPAYWNPGPDVIASYQAADLILLNGAGYAKWVDRAALPMSKLVDTSASFADRYIALEGAVTHSHGPEGAHEHVGWAFTTWLDPTLAAEQANEVTRALARARPVYEAVFNERLTAVAAELSSLDRRLAAAAAAVDGAPLIFSHPVYQYLERRYGLNGRSVHWEPDRAPGLAELQSLLEHHPARWVVWEGEPLASTVQALEAAGVGSVVFDPCGNRPAGGDFMSVMADNATALETIGGG